MKLFSLTLLFPTLACAATFHINATVLPIEELNILPNGQIHVVSNTGQKLENDFYIRGVHYQLQNCDLSPGRYIDVICDLVEVKK